MARKIEVPLPKAGEVFANVISSQEERDDALRERVMMIYFTLLVTQVP